jgi:hypothetical protein
MWCFVRPMKHPAFVQQLAIPPKPKLNCREGVVFTHTPGLGHHRSRPELPERFCAGSVTFLTDLPQTPARSDRLAGQTCPVRRYSPLAEQRRRGSAIRGRWDWNVCDRTRTFRYACIRLAAAGRRLHCRLSPVRREKRIFHHRGHGGHRGKKSEVIFCFSSVSSGSSRSLLRPGGESSFFSPSEELPTTGHGLTPISSRQRLEPAERGYARTGPLPFLRRMRQRVVLG